ncbi:hypothetical protein Q3G72_031614 [Acer saccharum]|nr:hypothetical protein Q3G72_031614 [Acer saccharum]
MQTLNMMKCKRVQIDDTQPLSGRGVVHVSSRKNIQLNERGSSLKINSNMQQVVGMRGSRFLENMSNSELGTINNLESANKNLEIMSDDSETEEPSDLNIDETQDDAGSASKKTRG